MTKRRAPTLLIGPFSCWDRMGRLFGSREVKRTLLGRSPARPQPPQPEPQVPALLPAHHQSPNSVQPASPWVSPKAPCLLPARAVQQKAQRAPAASRLSPFLLARRAVWPEWTSLPTVHARARGSGTAGTEEPRVLQMRKLLAGEDAAARSVPGPVLMAG